MMSTTWVKRPAQLWLWWLVGMLWLVFLWSAPLGGSLCLDELLTAWIVQGSASDTWSRSIQFQGQSPLYYLLVWMVRQCCGGSEVSLRLLSVLAGFGTTYVVARIARQTSAHPLVAPLAAVLLLASPDFRLAAWSARPYSLAILAASASILSTIGVCQAYSHRRGLAWALALLVTFYLHYLFAVVALGHAVFVLVWHRRVALRLIPWGALVAVCSVPGLWQVQSLAERAGVLCRPSCCFRVRLAF